MLIKALISDDLEFVRVAKEYLSLEDLQWIRNHRVGRGKIGGKAAGLVLAWNDSQAHPGPVLRDAAIPCTWRCPRPTFVGADVSYDFLDSTIWSAI